MIERFRRLLTWLAYQLAPKSPPKVGDEQAASLILYPSRRHHVELTARKSPGRISASQGTVTEERTLNEHHGY